MYLFSIKMKIKYCSKKNLTFKVIQLPAIVSFITHSIYKMLLFTKGTVPDLKFKLAIKKLIPIRCIPIPEAFEVETLEGKMQGKAGDWLMIGVQSEMWLCDKDIFEQTYDLVDDN